MILLGKLIIFIVLVIFYGRILIDTIEELNNPGISDDNPRKSFWPFVVAVAGLGLFLLFVYWFSDYFV